MVIGEQCCNVKWPNKRAESSDLGLAKKENSWNSPPNAKKPSCRAVSERGSRGGGEVGTPPVERKERQAQPAKRWNRMQSQRTATEEEKEDGSKYCPILFATKRGPDEKKKSQTYLTEEKRGEASPPT